VLDPYDPHNMFGVEDPVDDAVRTPAGGTVTAQLSLQRPTDASGLLEQRPDEKFDDRARDPLR
jgi:hypothetical protein